MITGTAFKHKRIHQVTWYHPDNKHCAMIDHIIVNSRFRSSVEDTRAYRGADIQSDHSLVISKIHLHLKQKRSHSIQKRQY